ncbi:diguanylate cyclase [Pseudomonas sp. LS44]|uniref:diguanylate cyclase n=1 Tax=Pseudomonas sp. LS44 TaxID=1357074 RepID=UPI00215A1DB2|nr:diguanylate cyclase [Pseudomonas sp. LS44]UVE18911.1 diguanylate cyclase [Pseudomonas sp. LS44]
MSFVRRAFWPRAIGLGVGFFAVAGVFWGRGEPLWLWGALALYCYVWPLLAYRIAANSHAPYIAEQRHVLIDSLVAGFWIATIQFNVLPTVMLLSMLAMNNTAAGGVRFVALGILLQVLGVGLSVLLLGFGFSPKTTPQQVYASIPMLVVHPMIIGLVLYQLAIQLAKHKKALRELSRIDNLTRLFNRGHWKELLQFEFEQCQQLKQGASLALIDVDHFKSTNDQHGHIAGDMVLRLVGERIAHNLRSEDLAGRYGGDEFCILLPRTSPERAQEILERLRSDVATLQCDEAPNLSLSLSIGIAGYEQHLTDATAWLREADRALYEAKRHGRNRIMLANMLTNDEWVTGSTPA